MSEFPGIIAAVQAAENNQSRDLWAIGDQVIKECGIPGNSGVNDGSFLKMKKASSEILSLLGIEYKPNSLPGGYETSPIHFRVRYVAHPLASLFSKKLEIRKLSMK